MQFEETANISTRLGWMLELSDQEFRTTMTNMVRVLTNKEGSLQEEMGMQDKS